MAEPLTDAQISRMAKARASFKVHALIYVVINLFLMGVWFASGGMADMHRGGAGWNYWPMWTHLGWGLGLAIHGIGAYGSGQSLVEREEKRIRERLGKT